MYVFNSSQNPYEHIMKHMFNYNQHVLHIILVKVYTWRKTSQGTIVRFGLVLKKRFYIYTSWLFMFNNYKKKDCMLKIESTACKAAQVFSNVYERNIEKHECCWFYKYSHTLKQLCPLVGSVCDYNIHMQWDRTPTRFLAATWLKLYLWQS